MRHAYNCDLKYEVVAVAELDPEDLVECIGHEAHCNRIRLGIRGAEESSERESSYDESE